MEEKQAFFAKNLKPFCLSKRLNWYLIAIIISSFSLQSQVFTKITTGPVVNEANNSYFATWGDYEKDGDLDLFHSLFFATVNNPLGNNFMFQNNCNGNFTKISQIPGGLVNDGLTGGYSYWIDYDNDGDLDLYAGPKFLYQNLGNGGFIKVNKTITTAIPIYPMFAEIGVASWADYDNDGFLDVFFGKQEIHRNNQNGDWTQLNIAPFTSSDPNAGVGGISWADYNNDGYMDVFVACVGDNVGQPTPNHLYRNLGNGSFVDETANASMINTRSYGACWVDYDDDLDMDLFINGTFGGNDKLFTNNGDGTFTEVLTGPIVANTIINQAGAGWADYDNDGDIDLYCTNFSQNVLYDNNGNGTFTQNTTEIVVNDTPVESYGAAWADYDNDGDLDLFVPTAFGDPNDNLYKNNVYQNNTANSKWLKLHLSGVSSNKDAIGARVYVKATINSVSKWQMREVNANSTRGGESGGASGHVVHFGLGNATIIDELKIVWPKSGTTQIFTNVSPNRFLEIVENINSLSDVVACQPDVPISNPGFVKGKVYSDVNNNCVFDSGIDHPIASKQVKAEPGAFFAFTDENGDYTLSLPDGPFVVSLNPQNDYVSVQGCQASSYNVSITSGSTLVNKDFASLLSIPCSGSYSLTMTSNGTSTCPTGPGMLTAPCPGSCHQYNFLIQNNTTLPSPANSTLAINFPAGFTATNVITSCPPLINSVLPAQNVSVTITNPIPVGGTCAVSVTVCLAIGTPAPYNITTTFLNPGPAGVNLLANQGFNLGNVGFLTQYGNPVAGNAFCTPNVMDFNVNAQPNLCINGWSGPGTPAGPSPNFLWANGWAPPAPVAPVPFVWRQVIPVVPNSMYQFTGSFANIIRDGIARALPNMQIRINTIPLGPNFLLAQSPLTPTNIPWVVQNRNWCSGPNNVATIDILSTAYVAAGNDFGIDNLIFQQTVGNTVLNSVQTVTCSCDPNNKSVEPLGCGANGNVYKNDNLVYTVRFQNEGSGPAFNILLSDVLDSDLDIGTFHVLSSSHPITDISIIPQNKLIIKFDNINLPPITLDPIGSIGWVKFSISPKAGLPDGTVVTNQTGIYFDQNDVVLTDVTKNTLYDKPYPEPYFDYNHSCPNTGYVYDFKYTGGTPDNATYLWTFDGGVPATSTQQNPTAITFTNGAGVKNVKLVVSRNGCTAENNDEIQVISGLSDNGKMVTICHNGSILEVSVNALQAHLAHGDCVGECPSSSRLQQPAFTTKDLGASIFEVGLMPNPSNNECTIKVIGANKPGENIKIQITNYLGQLVSEVYNSNATSADLQVKVDTRNFSDGIYFVRSFYAGQIDFKKLVIQH